jgi:hypothetical protein
MDDGTVVPCWVRGKAFEDQPPRLKQVLTEAQEVFDRATDTSAWYGNGRILAKNTRPA